MDRRGEPAVEGCRLRASGFFRDGEAGGSGAGDRARGESAQPGAPPAASIGCARVLFQVMELAVGGFARRSLMILRLSFAVGRLKLSISAHAPCAVIRVPGRESRVARLGSSFCRRPSEMIVIRRDSAGGISLRQRKAAGVPIAAPLAGFILMAAGLPESGTDGSPHVNEVRRNDR